MNCGECKHIPARYYLTGKAKEGVCKVIIALCVYCKADYLHKADMQGLSVKAYPMPGTEMHKFQKRSR